MAIALVNSGDSGVTAIASGSAATVLPSNSVIGNTVIVGVQVQSTTLTLFLSGMTSTMGTPVFLGRIRVQAGEYGIEVWKIPVTAAGTTITATDSSGAKYSAVALQWSGVGSVAFPGSNSATTGTSVSQTITPLTSKDAIVVIALSGNPMTASPSSPWSNYNAGTWTAANGLGCAYQVVSSTANVTATWTQLTQDWETLGVILSPITSSAGILLIIQG